MKVLIAKWSGYGYSDIITAYKDTNHELVIYEFDKSSELRTSEDASDLVELVKKEHPSYIFSFNYFPFIAHVAKETETKYVSWIYDSPFVMMYSYTVAFPTNYVFVFDKAQYTEFRNGGINTVYYLPLAANAKRLNGYTDEAYFKKTPWYNKADIAFVGSLYNEDHQFYDRLEHISDYTRGYLEGIISAQKKIYGINFIQDVLPKHIMDDMHEDLPMEVSADGVETLEYLYAQYVINRHITGLERLEMLTRIGQKYNFDLYTYNKNFNIKGCINHGSIDSVDGAPHIYHKAKINLNISLRSIITGVPLRAFEVTGSEGFLLTNYQPDFDDVFEANNEYVYYEDTDDLMNKIDYFLTHENDRKEIAHNGYIRCLKDHNYENRIKTMEEIITQ